LHLKAPYSTGELGLKHSPYARGTKKNALMAPELNWSRHFDVLSIVDNIWVSACWFVVVTRTMSASISWKRRSAIHTTA
jgi:hypothetical protein